MLPLALSTACLGEPVPDDVARDGATGDASEALVSCDDVTRYATRVVSFAPGDGATFGADRLPDVVLGAPQGGGDFRGGTDVVSLGLRGEIVLEFSRAIVDGPGDDLTVFENAFEVPGAMLRYWEELGEVSVSEDGATWKTFACDPSGARPHANCAGWTPVYASTAAGVCGLDPRVSGGDGFDLATVGLRRARFVRVRDLGTQGVMPPSTGFDLDAVAALHSE